VLVSGVQRRGLAPLEMVRDWGIPIISWSVLTTCRISVASGWKIEFGMRTVCGSASPCRITAPFFWLVRCFVLLFCLVAYFDVGLLFRPVVLFGCLF
jgi:hypothetical protein